MLILEVFYKFLANFGVEYCVLEYDKAEIKKICLSW